jgi:hypothetical protein
MMAYVLARFEKDPHLWATTLFDELVELGFALSYRPTISRCEPRRSSRATRTTRGDDDSDRSGGVRNHRPELRATVRATALHHRMRPYPPLDR